MNGFDSVWYNDTPDNRANIVAMTIFDKKPFERILKECYTPRAFNKLKKLNSVAVKILGEYYLKPIPISESIKYVRDLNAEGIHIRGEQEATQYMASQTNIELPLGTPQWRAHYIENYSDTESALFMTVHHSYGDGLALMI